MVFIFFTVWNWWLLAFFFLASTLTSARAVLGGFGSKSKTSSASHLQQASVVGLTAATLYQIVTPVGFLNRVCIQPYLLGLG